MDVGIEVQRLRVFELGIGDRLGLGAPVRRQEAGYRAGEVPRAKVVVAGFGVALLAGEEVGIVGGARKYLAEGGVVERVGEQAVAAQRAYLVAQVVEQAEGGRGRLRAG